MTITAHSSPVLLVTLCFFIRGVECSLPLDFLWTPNAPNGSNVTEFTCQCFTYMDAITGQCLPSSITSRLDSMKSEIEESPLLNNCQYKRVILGMRVVIRCPYSRKDSYWSSLGRWNATDICIESSLEEQGDLGSQKCGRNDRIILNHLNELIIDPFLSTDPGIYECVKLNTSSKVDKEIFRLGIVLDYDTALYGQLVYSSIVGSMAAAGFLAIALSAHFLRVLIEYCRNEEMNKHVQWVIEFVSRAHPAQGPGGRTFFRYPPNGGIITEKIEEEAPMNENGEILEAEATDVVVIDSKIQADKLATRSWYPYMGVRMEHLSSIRDRASQQMDKVRARYNERALRVRTQCGSQMDQLHQRYHAKLAKMKDYSSSRYYKIRVKYYKKRQDLNNYANMKMSLIRNNYQLQRQYLAKVMDSLAIDSCRSYAPSFMGSEDYQASLRGGDSLAAGLDLDSIPGEDGASSMASSRRIPTLVDEDDDDSVNIDIDWECLTPPELPPPKKRPHSTHGDEEPISPPDSPVLASKGGKAFAGCLISCHTTQHHNGNPPQIPPQLLRCSAFQMGMCSDGRHNHMHGPKNNPLLNGSLMRRKKNGTSSSPVSTAAIDDQRTKSAVIDGSNGVVSEEPLIDKNESEPAITLRAIEESLPFADE